MPFPLLIISFLDSVLVTCAVIYLWKRVGVHVMHSNLTVKLEIIFFVVDLHFYVIKMLEAFSCLLVARPLALKLQWDITLKALCP